MFKFHTARVLTTAILILALFLSFTHIAAAFGDLGAGWEKWTAPFLIDTVAIIGKIASGVEFTGATRRAGRRALYVAGSVSLVANVWVGASHEQYGAAIIGAIVVIVALWGEGLLSHLRPTASTRKNATRKATTSTAVVNRDGKTVEQVKRSAAARKAAATRKANQAAKTPAVADDTRAYI